MTGIIKRIKDTLDAVARVDKLEREAMGQRAREARELALLEELKAKYRDRGA